MSKRLPQIAIAVILIAVAGAGFFLWRHHTADKESSDSADTSAEVKPTATVTIAPLTAGSLDTQMTVFGAIVARPESVHIVSVPFESQATQIGVSLGQHVSAGQIILQLRPSVAARAALDDARNTVAAAERDLKLVQQRYDQKLATNSDLFAAQNALRSAQTKLTGLTQIDSDQPTDLKADADSIISKIDVQPGQTSAAGAPLIETIPQAGVQAKLAVDPSFLKQLKVDQPVDLTPNGASAAIQGHIATVTNHVDPATHMADVFVTLPPGAPPIDTPLVAKLTLPNPAGFIVPHDAVVPDEDGNYELFTVSGDKAVKHTVQVIAQDDEKTEISGGDLKPGDLVVVAGNYVLEDGMAVTTDSAKPSASRPDPGADK
jgi:RND family efflux transporter MFP subunit